MKFPVVLLLALGSAAALAGSPADPLEAGFLRPPASARAHVYWIWMNGNVTREGITADLEAMADAGIGGALTFSLAGPMHQCDTPAGPVDYLSPQWLDLMKHAATEAGRLGLELGMHNCAGWATTGGPWITPDLAMQRLVSSEITLEGGKTIEQKLPQPEVTLGHYRDIAVFAVPAALDGNSRLPKWESKAGQRGGPGGRQPDLSPLPDGAAIPLDAVVCVSENLRADGSFVWKAPPGRWKIVRLGHTPTGMTNKPAPASATGLEIDKLRRHGMDVHWRHAIQPVLNHLGPLVGKSFNLLEIDSYEAGLHHWTPRLREEFTQRRGYDPTPYLLALTGRVLGDGPRTERFLWDIRRTISDLFAENYYGYTADLCHQQGLGFTTEPYTSCFEGLQVAAKTDVPMAEFWANGGYAFSMRLAASLAHIHNRPVAAAEAFTAGPPLGRWLDHPGSLKRVGDIAWTEGINRFVLHSYAHQPWMDKLPGMTMGQYGCHFSRNSTWWKPGRAWLSYISRAQFLLQSGEPCADVLCFAGNAAPNGAVHLDDLKRAGFDYDSCGTDTFVSLSVDDGAVVLPSGKRYRLLVLPNHGFHTPPLARKIRELVRAGATIAGPKPQHSPSLENFPASENDVRAVGDEVWGNCDGNTIRSNSYGKGRVFSGMPPAEVLTNIGVPPAVAQPPGDSTLAWIHRRSADAEWFFVSNTGGAAVRTTLGFRVTGKAPELWNAVDGTMHPAAGWTVVGAHTAVPLALNAGESLFVVFRRAGTPETDPVVRAVGPSPYGPLSPALVGGTEPRVRVWENGTHTFVRASGKSDTVAVTGVPAHLTLSNPWSLRFQATRGAPAQVRFPKLMSWSEHADPGIRYFSGTATYSTEFALPAAFLTTNGGVWLDLGEVAVIAEVRLNGKDLGVLWQHPFRVDIHQALRPGANILEVDVSNLWVNRLIGDEQHPDDCAWTGKALTRWPDWFAKGTPRPSTQRVAFTTWKHWSATDPLLPSGLLGPVTIHAARLQAPANPPSN